MLSSMGELQLSIRTRIVADVVLFRPNLLIDSVIYGARALEFGKLNPKADTHIVAGVQSE